MAKLTFQSASLIKGSKEKVVLAVREGQIAEETARELGLIWYDPKDGDGCWYYDHPTNVMAIRAMKAVYEEHGFKLKVKLQDAKQRDLTNLLHPREVRYHSRGFVRTFVTGGGIQAPIALDKMAIGIMAKNHARLASAAVLLLIEDYDPEEMKEKIRKDRKKGEVWGFASKISGVEKRLTGYDFKITLCETIWNRLDGPTKRYMIDHELMHCGRNVKTGRWEMWDHDVQLFLEEIHRYGGQIKEVDRIVDSLVGAHKAGKRKRAKRRSLLPTRTS